MKDINGQYISDEVVAVISAAIAAMDVKPGYKLVVKSFKRIPQTTPVWNMTGRYERLQRKLN